MKIHILPNIAACFLSFLITATFYPLDALAISPSESISASNSTIKVAYPLFEDSASSMASGVRTGYTYEYLEEIAQYTGWDYEVVNIPAGQERSLDTLLDMVKNGDVDLLGGVFYDEGLADVLTFSSQSYGIAETLLQTTPENINRVIVNSQTEQTMRIAVLNDDSGIKELESYCQLNLIRPEYVICQDSGRQLEAVMDGRADVLLNTSMNPVEGVYTIARFAPKPFYFATAKGAKSDLMDRLNAALLEIGHGDPYFSSNLYKKYFESHGTAVTLSEDEKNYIEQAGLIKVGLVPGQPPYHYYDEDGRLCGITSDFLELITLKTGLGFEIIQVESVEELFEMARRGELDLVPGLIYDYEFSKQNDLVLTRPYLSAQYMMVSRRGAGEPVSPGKRLALPITNVYRGYTVGTVINFETRSQCVEAVHTGRADYTYVDACTAQYYINQPAYRNLSMAPDAYGALKLCFGIPKPADTRLLTLMNKVVRSLTLEETQSIITKHTFPNQDYSVSDFVRAHPVVSVAVVSLVFLVITALMALLMYQRLKHHRESSIELEKRLRVYALANDYFFEYHHPTKLLALSAPCPEEASGVKLMYFDYTDEKARARAEDLLDLITSHVKGVDECRAMDEDGKEHWLRVAFERIYGRDSEPVYTIGKINVIDQEKEERRALETRALHDSLTGVYNVQACQEKIEEALAHMDGSGAGAFLLLDIDHFKLINDIYGHSQGDTVLRRLAELLCCNARKDDIIGRFGGDEFIVYFRGIGDRKIIENRCLALQEAIRQDCLDNRQSFTVSIGAVFSSPGCRYEELFRAADGALYSAKAKGRNCFVITGQGSGSETTRLTAPQWLVDSHYQVALNSIGAIAFEFAPATGGQYVSPFISSYLAGNYKGRRLFDVLQEDHVIHPEDEEKFNRFLEGVYKGDNGGIALRMMSAGGSYGWFKITVTSADASEKSTMMGLITDMDGFVRQEGMPQYEPALDAVSGIYNKNAFFKGTKELLDRAPDEEHFIIRFDINRFKLVNEIYSVSEGDRVLHHLGAVVSQLSRPGETYGRLGDDVFCMCLRRTREETVQLIESLEKEINRRAISYQFILSAGILHLPHYEGTPINILCDRAALAQRTVKGNYVNRYAFFEKSMRDTLNREHYITGLMKQALEHREFQVYFQPKYDIRDGRIIGAESLVRWMQPKEGMISPGEFIPLFERNGFILPLDEYVWDMTFCHMRSWIDKGLPVVPVSVNVSRMHLYDPEFCDKVIALRDKYDLPPKLMEMEITESAYTEHPQKLYGIMDKLQEQGFIFSMDDFGSGYSSLNVLKDIPVDIVKIDLNFLKESRRGEKAGRAVLEGAIQLVRGIGLPIIAEGVETKEQVDFLHNAGCTAAQGYYYARPMPEKDFEGLLRKCADR